MNVKTHFSGIERDFSKIHSQLDLSRCFRLCHAYILGLLLFFLGVFSTSAQPIMPTMADTCWDDRFTVRSEVPEGPSFSFDMSYIPGLSSNLVYYGSVIFASTTDGKGYYVAGQFTEIGGITATNIAYWNGLNWEPLGSGTDGPVRAMIMVGNDLYAAGDFHYAGGVEAKFIARWDGTRWSSVGTWPTEVGCISAFNMRCDSGVVALASHNNQLYAGILSYTFFVNGVVSSVHVYQWNGLNWKSLNLVLSLSDYGGYVELQPSTPYTSPTTVYISPQKRTDVVTHMRVTPNGGLVFKGNFYNIEPKGPSGPYDGIIVYEGGQWLHSSDWLNQITQTNIQALELNDVLTVGSEMYVSGRFVLTRDPTNIIGHLMRITDHYEMESHSGFHDGKVVAMSETQGQVWVVTDDLGLRAQWKTNGVWKWSGGVVCYKQEPSWTGLINIAATRERLLLVSPSLLTTTTTGYVLDDHLASFDHSSGWCTWREYNSLRLDGAIQAMAPYGNWTLIGGNFTASHDAKLNHVAGWNSAFWRSMDSGILEGPVTAVAGSPTGVYAAVTNVYQWNGQIWSKIPVDPDLARYETNYITVNTYHDAKFEIRTIEIAGNNKFYMGGDFKMKPGPGRAGITNLAFWNGAAWEPVGNGSPDQSVFSIVAPNNNESLGCYIGGNFKHIGVVNCSSIAYWDGRQWSSLGDGVDGEVSCMAYYQGQLVIGGTFTHAGGIPASGIARWNGRSWEALGAGVSGWVDRLAINGTDVYAAGNFHAAGGQAANNIALWHAGRWEALGSGLLGSGLSRTKVTGLVLANEGLFVSGDFSYAGGKRCPGFALWTAAQPNQIPTVDFVGLTNNTIFTASANITLLATASDADGRVISVRFDGDSSYIDEVANAPYTAVWHNVPAGQHTITALATDNLGSWSRLSSRTIIVQSPQLPATITVHPQSRNAYIGDKVTFTVSLGNAGTAYRYQWFHGDRALVDNKHTAGAKSSALVLSNLQLEDAGGYKVTVFVGSNSNMSQTAHLDVQPAPVWTVQLTKPQAGEALNKQRQVPLEVLIENNPQPVMEVWYYASSEREVKRIAVSKSPPKFPSASSISYNGQIKFWAMAIDQTGRSKASDRVVLTIQDIAEPPSILSVHPKRFPVNARPGDAVVLSATVFGSEPIEFQWWADSKMLIDSSRMQGTKTPTLNLLSVQIDDTAQYKLTAKNAYGQVQSVGLSLKVSNTALALRFLPETYTPGLKLEVKLSAMPRTNAQVYAVEEELLPGWAVGKITDGVYDKQSRKVKFGPYFDNKARSLTYEVIPPLSAADTVRFRGLISIDNSSLEGVTGDITMTAAAPTVCHPADMDQNNRISIYELTRFAWVWRKGTFLPDDWIRQISVTLPGILLGRPDGMSLSLPDTSAASYVTRAAMLWKKGEAYYYLTNTALPLCWTNDSAVGPDSSENSGSLAAVSIGQPKRMVRLLSVPTQLAVRELPASYTPGRPLTVIVRISPEMDTIAYALEEQPPVGWAVRAIDQDGELDNINGTIKWGPFFDNQLRIFSYEITPPLDISGLALFNGLVSIDGEDVLVGGTQAIDGGSDLVLTPIRFETIKFKEGQLYLQLSGIGGTSFNIEQSSNLKQWLPLTNLLDSSGDKDLLLPVTSQQPLMFFRAYRPH